MGVRVARKKRERRHYISGWGGGGWGERQTHCPACSASLQQDTERQMGELGRGYIFRLQYCDHRCERKTQTEWVRERYRKRGRQSMLSGTLQARAVK